MENRCNLSVPISLHSHASFVHLFNGLNFSEWCEQVQFHLGVLDLDIPLQVKKPIVVTDKRSDEENTFHKLLKRSNKLNLMFMGMTSTNNIKATLPQTNNAKEFMKIVKEHSQTADKPLASTLMSILTNLKSDGSRIMHEHVLEMTNLGQD
ncbi:hypothetical protein CDL12_15501 [Handroanthus impetiginosus]|uniref:Retrotransposon Copia-like N-terminal domain-containing protein n=1 Tax=Handroanthus impetiginosus TaxID=429701 RepID=A0A2G9H312_9LAMI|nr:hypothetical protein CDL12_15501 [Handroanthus impetiginosus]